MAGKISQESDEELASEINMIPLVDIMLVLLIIFMVAAPMMNDMVNVTLPKAKAQASRAEEKSVVLTVSKAGKMFIGQTEVPLAELRAKVESIFLNRDKKEIFINADESVTHGEIIKAMAAIQSAGVQKISFLTDPTK